jgi:putative ABC transport system ATP-binding protein
MIRLTSIHKAYDPETSGAVLKGLNLEIPEGQFVAILGQSGSGKTTLLNIIGGLDRDFTGSAMVDGRELKTMKDRELSRFRNTTIGFVFQTFNLLPHLPCAANVAFPAFFSPRISGRKMDSMAREAMERVGISHKARAFPNKLSGGEKQRVAIARALFQKPRVLLADEPTGNLDSKTGRHIMDIFMQLNREHRMTCVLVTHDEDLARMTHRIVRIVDGVITGEEKLA